MHSMLFIGSFYRSAELQNCRTWAFLGVLIRRCGEDNSSSPSPGWELAISTNIWKPRVWIPSMACRDSVGLETIFLRQHSIALESVVIQARKVYKTALVNRKKELGADHVKGVDRAFALGKSYFEQERLIEAEPLLRHAVDMS